MRTLTALTVLVPALALNACSSDTPAAIHSATWVPATARASRALDVSASRPMSGHCELTTIATVPFPAPPVFRQTAEGTCHLTHLGKTSVHFVQIANFGTFTQQSIELTYTAANGDVLRAASAGTSRPIATGVSFSSTIIFQGGTGRFVAATGEVHVDGTANLAAATSQYTLDGWIVFDAGDAHGK